MNNQLQIENLTLQRNQRLIILDSCVYVEDKKRHGRILTVLAGKARKYNLRLALPKIVLYEVSKVTASNSNKVLNKIIRVFKNYTTIEENNDIRTEANRLETQFYEVHRSDSVILAIARINSAILVTMDRKLLRSAQMEGVEAYSLREFMKNWGVLH